MYYIFRRQMNTGCIEVLASPATRDHGRIWRSRKYIRTNPKSIQQYTKQGARNAANRLNKGPESFEYDHWIVPIEEAGHD